MSEKMLLLGKGNIQKSVSGYFLRKNNVFSTKKRQVLGIGGFPLAGDRQSSRAESERSLYTTGALACTQITTYT